MGSYIEGLQRLRVSCSVRKLPRSFIVGKIVGKSYLSIIGKEIVAELAKVIAQL